MGACGGGVGKSQKCVVGEKGDWNGGKWQEVLHGFGIWNS